MRPPIRVLYSFPHKIGAGRITETAWQQVAGLSAAGGDVLVYPGAVAKSLPESVRVRPTLARGRARIPYRVLGQRRALHIHDKIVARRLGRLAGCVDIVHTWPSGALETLTRAAELGIPTVLERPNAHTRYAFEVVQQEADRLGVTLPAGYEHAFDAAVLEREEEEFRLADKLLCPSDFVRQSFVYEGYPEEKLVRHSYGFDDTVFHPDPDAPQRPFTALFVGVAAVRKGLHFALEAWLQSPAHRDGVFLIAGSFLPAYEAKLTPLLAHPSIHVLGHRDDVSQLMRRSDVLILPSVEEGSPLAALEALGSGSVPLVSEVCIGACQHGRNALVHKVGDVQTLADQISSLHDDPSLLASLRERGLKTAPELTWKAAGVRLLDVYADTAQSAAKRADR